MAPLPARERAYYKARAGLRGKAIPDDVLVLTYSVSGWISARVTMGIESADHDAAMPIERVQLWAKLAAVAGQLAPDCAADHCETRGGRPIVAVERDGVVYTVTPSRAVMACAMTAEAQS